MNDIPANTPQDDAPETPAGATPPPAADDSVPGSPTSDERTMAMLAHLGGIVLGFLAPLIIWLIKKDESKFVDYHGKEALNFQIMILIAVIISNVLIMVVIGCILLPAVVIADIIFCIIAGLAANKGEMYRYPFSIRLIK